MNEVQYYKHEEEYYTSVCNGHSIKFSIEDGLKYAEEHSLDCEDMPCAKDCPLMNEEE